jgi:hypothetical protein
MARIVQRFRRPLWVEPLEPRELLSVALGGNWDDPAQWSPPGVPDPTTPVLIPAGVTVNLTPAQALAHDVTILGTLHVPGNGEAHGNEMHKLSTHWIEIGQERPKNTPCQGAGRLEAGAPGPDQALNLPGGLEIELLGKRSDGVDEAFIKTRGNGTLALFGATKTSWTHLSATAHGPGPGTPPDDRITISSPHDNWQVGDQIVIASTSARSPSFGSLIDESEMRTIVGIVNGGQTFVLDSPLAFTHFGEIQTYNLDRGAVSLDERAEVGMLTHNIKIHGDAHPEADGFGAYTTFMDCSQAQLSNVELARVGQRGLMDNLPLYWDGLGPAAGNYVGYSSIHNSYNRGIALANTQNMTVEYNVVFDHIGHGIFLEDGLESGNRINYNLVLRTRTAPASTSTERFLATEQGPKSFQDAGPSSFWITNPNNSFVGNVAAGSEGSGYWFALPEDPLHEPQQEPPYHPIEQPIGSFQGNTAHSTLLGLDTGDSIDPACPDDPAQPCEKDVPNAGWRAPSTIYFDQFTGYANALDAVYHDNNTDLEMRGTILADNLYGVFFAGYETLDRIPPDGLYSTVIARSRNFTLNSEVFAYAIYDGAGSMRDVNLVGFDDPDAYVFDRVGAAVRHTNHKVSGLAFYNAAGARIPPVPVRFKTLPDKLDACNPPVFRGGDPRMWAFSILDEDGSLTGTAGGSVVPNDRDQGMLGTPTDPPIPPGWQNARLSVQTFGHLRLYPGSSQGDFDHCIPLMPSKPTLTTARHRPTQPPDATFRDDYQVDPWHQMAVIVNGDYEYDLTYDMLPEPEKGRRQIDLFLQDVGPDKSVVLHLGYTQGPPVDFFVLSALQVFSLVDLRAATETSWFLEGNTVWLKVFGMGREDAPIHILWNVRGAPEPGLRALAGPLARDKQGNGRQIDEGESWATVSLALSPEQLDQLFLQNHSETPRRKTRVGAILPPARPAVWGFQVGDWQSGRL